MNKLPILATGLFVLFTMAACGGGGSSSDSTFRVSTSVGTGGSVSPSSVSVIGGNTVSLSVTPNTGHQINSVSGCGGSLSGNTYTTAPITANCVVTASFSVNTYTVTATAGMGGSITPTSGTVNHGSTVSFTVRPASGYTIDSVSGCSGSLSGNTFTTAAITGNCSVSASFRESETTPPPPTTSFPVTTAITGNGSGTISPTQAIVLQGQTADFQVVPSAGSTIESVTGCGGSLSGNTYTTGPITSGCQIVASFSQLPPPPLGDAYWDESSWDESLWQ